MGWMPGVRGKFLGLFSVCRVSGVWVIEVYPAELLAKRNTPYEMPTTCVLQVQGFKVKGSGFRVQVSAFMN